MDHNLNDINQDNYNMQNKDGVSNNQSLNENANMGNILVNSNESNENFINQSQFVQPNTYGVNQNQSNIPKKKFSIWLAVGILIVITIVIAIVILLLMGKNKDVGIDLLGQNEKSISSEEISKYELETDTIWINKPLGITYNIPKRLSVSLLLGSEGFCYIHGCSFNYDYGYSIYVDKSVEGHTNLKTLASDIIGEKNSDKYKNVYNFGSDTKIQFSNAVTQNIKIGKIDTVYFESEEIDTNGIFVNNQLKIKIIGYSFKYNNEYISVYGETSVDEDDNALKLKQIMQYLINSIKVYNGESLSKLGGNAKNYYDGGYTSSTCLSSYFDKDGKCTSDECLEKCNKNYFVVNFLSGHTLNGVLANYGKAQDVVKEIDPSMVNWDGSLDGIFSATQNSKIYNNKYSGKKSRYYEYDFPWVLYNYNTLENVSIVEILKEEKINIDGTDIKKYLIKTKNSRFDGYYIAVYTFILDGKPYVMSYHLSSSAYYQINLMTQEQLDTMIKQTEIVADSFILTFRILNLEPYNEYIDYSYRY